MILANPTFSGSINISGSLNLNGDPIQGNSVGTATGGTESQDSTYKYHTFTSSGNFTVSGGDIEVEAIIVAGGGGAGYSDGTANCGGGGGAGGLVLMSSTSLSAAT